METNKVIAYSLLAQIRNSGNFINSSVEIFVPIVKYALYKHITQTGVYKGASIIEISTWINKYFHYCPVKAGKSVFEIVET